MFITFEGIAGCGKTLQADLLYNRLRTAYRKREIVFTSEPNGTDFGKEIKKLVHSANEDLPTYTEFLLLQAAREKLMQEIIAPALDRGAIVICDRFIDSTIAYQHFGKSVPMELIEELTTKIVGDYMPDKTFVIDISPDEAVSRMELKQDKSFMPIKRKKDFLSRVRTGYTYQAAKENERVSIIFGCRSVDEIATDIFVQTIKYLENKPVTLPIEAKDAREASKILAEEEHGSI